MRLTVVFSSCGGVGLCCVGSHEDLGECVGAGTGEELFGGVEGDRVDRLVVFLPVGGHLLHTRAGLQVPQPHGAVVTAGQDVQAGGVSSQRGDRVQMSHHLVHHFATGVVEKPAKH